jgi:uncharacterized membrane protein
MEIDEELKIELKALRDEQNARLERGEITEEDYKRSTEAIDRVRKLLEK